MLAHTSDESGVFSKASPAEKGRGGKGKGATSDADLAPRVTRGTGKLALTASAEGSLHYPHEPQDLLPRVHSRRNIYMRNPKLTNIRCQGGARKRKREGGRTLFLYLT